MVQINDLAVSFVRFVIPNITTLFEQNNPVGTRFPFLTQEHGIWLLNNIYNVAKGDPKMFGAVILFAPLSTEIFDHILECHNIYSPTFIASCFDTTLIENLCAPQPPSARIFLQKLSHLIYPGGPWLKSPLSDLSYTHVIRLMKSLIHLLLRSVLIYVIILLILSLVA